MDINQYMGMFMEESKEHLQTLNHCLLELESDPNNLETLDEIFRSAHTIKGMSATMGFTDIAELTHEMENVLDKLRKSELMADEEIINVLFQCVDTLEQSVEKVASGSGEAIEVDGLIQHLRSLAAGNKGMQISDKQTKDTLVKEEIQNISKIVFNSTEETVVKEAIAMGLRAIELSISIREGCLLKSARVYMVMNALEEIGEIIKTVPSAEELEREDFEQTFQVIMVTGGETEKIEQMVMSISEIESVQISLCNVPGITKKIPAPSEASSNPAPVTASSKAAAPSADKKVRGGQSVRVDIDKLDTLLNLVGELVINKTRLEQIGQTHRLTDLVETIEQMDRVTTDLQAVVMKVRMVPVGQVFNRFPRMIRDLSHELNKEINLIIQGEETELDRTVIDEIGDPLVHLLRNAIDHGIEHPNERKAKGKNPVGEVRLVASHEGNNVIILVEDDGHGIDPDRVKAKAVEKGLLTQAEADKMETAEAVRLVFAPGFSTAEAVTDVSGRGVGMDAVKTKIESLGGMVDVETRINEGSRFKIRLPLTLAIIQALSVRVSEEIYAIPLGSIDSTINIQPSDIKTIQNQEAILLRGQIIPIVRLANILDVPKQQAEEPNDLFVVIVHMGEQKTGIIVDALIGQQEIVIKSLGKLLAGIKVIAGATVLGNGQVALILDVGPLMQ